MLNGVEPGNGQNVQTEQRTSHDLARVAVKIPPFWRQRPKVWFHQVESSFQIAGVTSEITKFHYVLANLESSVIDQVSHLIEIPDPTTPYTTIKNAIIDSFSDSETQRLKQLLEGLELGDQKPTQLLKQMKDLAGTAIEESVLKFLFISRLPKCVQTILSVSDEGLNKLALMSDKITEVTQPGPSLAAFSSSRPSLENKNI